MILNLDTEDRVMEIWLICLKRVRFAWTTEQCWAV
jgi:hypothetical protein